MEKKTNKVRCKNCKVKLKLMVFTCKCNHNFCIGCLQPEKHNCTYDFKTEGKKRIEEKNPIVINSKVPTI